MSTSPRCRARPMTPAAIGDPNMSGNRARTWIRITRSLCAAPRGGGAGSCARTPPQPRAARSRSLEQPGHRFDHDAALVAVDRADHVGDDGDEVLTVGVAYYEDVVEAGGECLVDAAEWGAVGGLDAEAFDLVVVELVCCRRWKVFGAHE